MPLIEEICQQCEKIYTTLSGLYYQAFCSVGCKVEWEVRTYRMLAQLKASEEAGK